MSWRLAFHSTKVLLSYVFPYKVRAFRDAIFKGDANLIRQLAAERPRLLQQAIDADGNTAIGTSFPSIDSFRERTIVSFLNRFGHHSW